MTATLESNRKGEKMRAAQCSEIRCLGRSSQPRLQRFVFTFADGNEQSHDFDAMRRLSWWRDLPAEKIRWIDAVLEYGARVLDEQASEVCA
jgi:hypothetical protein